MADQNNTTAPVLPLPPLEYDIQYMNNLIRLLNFWIQQQQNPGSLRGTAINLASSTRSTEGSVAPDVVFDTLADRTTTLAILKYLPTSSAGLVKDQIWNDAGTLKIIT